VRPGLALGVLLAASAASACGGARAAPAGEVATGRTLTSFQRERLLGHYSTRDGATGFILDRTVDPPRAKLDGVDKVVTLEATPGRGRSTEYRSSDPPMWMRIDEEGEVLLFEGPKQHEGVAVRRDADAEQLSR
jgi:hypothetical protein